MQHVGLPSLGRTVLLLCLFGAGSAAFAGAPATYRFPLGARIQAVRSADLDGDGRQDLVVLAASDAGQTLTVLRAPAQPTPGRFYGEADVVEIPHREGALASAGALALGRFGPKGAWRLRFLAPAGVVDTTPDGTVLEGSARHRVPTLLGRSAGRGIVFWDAVGDLDGDRVDECWFPLGEGPGRVRILGGTPAGDRTLDLSASNRGFAGEGHVLRRVAYTPNLVPADLEGDGRMELVAWRPPRLAVFAPYAAQGESANEDPVKPAFFLDLPFTKDDLHPDEVHTPRLQLADVDADGITDLLVTLVTGNRRKLTSFRTRLLHFPGPFRDPDTGGLVAPGVRIDTESVVLHPRFVDVDGDGALDYVSDAVRGTRADMIQRLLGRDPEIWYVAFRFDRAAGTFETAPWFRVERTYSREEAVNNRFGITAFFAGDFDGDGHKDLLDLGNLDGLEVRRAVRKRGPGPGDPVAFSEALFPYVRMPSPLLADAFFGDLDGDGRADAAVWNEKEVFLLVSGGAK